jgi:hypothetical protein
MTVSAEADVVERMLSGGHITRIDDGGHAHTLYGVCPDDGARAPIHRVSRAGHRIIEVILRCPACGRDITAEPAALRIQ